MDLQCYSPGKATPLLSLSMVSLLIVQQFTCYKISLIVFFKKKSMVIKLLHVISLIFSILPTMESNENIWQWLALWNHPREKSHIEYSPGPNPSNPSFYQFRKMYLRFTESHLSSLFHTLFIKSVPTTAREHLAWNVMINTNRFFYCFRRGFYTYNWG